MGGGCGRCDHHPIRDFLRDVGEALFGSSESSSRSISREDRYDPEKAKMEETIRINNTLTTFRTRCENASDKLERDVLKSSRENLDNMVRFLKDINNKKYGNQKLNINIERLERENRDTEDLINGYIKKNIQKRVSLDDTECLNVLKMNAGTDKEKAMNEYLNKVLREALSGLTGKIESSIKNQMENIQNQIEVRISTYEEFANDKISAFEEIEKIKSSGEFERETHVGVYAFKGALCGIGENILMEG